MKKLLFSLLLICSCYFDEIPIEEQIKQWCDTMEVTLQKYQCREFLGEHFCDIKTNRGLQVLHCSNGHCNMRVSR